MPKLGSLSQKLSVSDLDELINKLKAWFESRGFRLERVKAKDKDEKVDRKYVFGKSLFIRKGHVWVYIKGSKGTYELKIEYSKRLPAEDIDALIRFWNTLPTIVSPMVEREEVIRCKVCGYVITDPKAKTCPNCGAKLA